MKLGNVKNTGPKKQDWHGRAPQNCESGKEKAAIWTYKCIITGGLALALMCFGLETCLLSPTVIDLRERLNLTMEEFSRTYVARNFGAMLGSVLGGMLSDRFNRHISLVMAVALFVTGILTTLRPWSPDLFSLGVNSFLCGIAHSAINPTANMLLWTLWGKEATTPMFVMHTGFAVGCPLAPFLAKNYLSQRRRVKFHSLREAKSASLNNEAEIHVPHSWWLYGDNSQVEIPLAAVGALFIGLALVFCVLHFSRPPRTFKSRQEIKSSWSEVCSLGKDEKLPENPTTKRKIILLLSLFYVAMTAMESPLFSFLFSFTVDSELEFSKQEAVYLDSAGKIAVLLSRLTSIAASRYLSIHSVLTYGLLGCVFSVFGLAFLGKYNSGYLWFFACTNGFFMSSLWPSGYSWARQYINVSGTIVGIWDVSSATSRVINTWFAGYLYQFHSPYAIFSLSSFNALFALLTFVLMHIMHMRYLSRKKSLHPIQSL